MTRYRRFVLEGDSLTWLFETGLKFEVIEGFPEGSKFLGFSQDPLTNSMIVFVEHESFEEVKDGGFPLTEEIEVRDIRGNY